MFEKLQGKGKVTLNKEDFTSFFYTFLNLMSEEWKEIKDKTIKILRGDNERLRKELQQYITSLHEMTQAYNRHIHTSNVIKLKLEERIMDLKKRIRELKKENCEKCQH